MRIQNSYNFSNKQFSLGLTGGIASGKSKVARIFHSLGAAIIDTDVIAYQLTTQTNTDININVSTSMIDSKHLHHAITGAAIPEIIRCFGRQFIDVDGNLNRPMMRACILKDSKKRQCLEAILHPMIYNHAQLLIKYAQADYSIVVVPLLIEHLSQWNNAIDRILVIDCEVAIQKQRLLQRIGISNKQVNQLLAIQTSRQQRLLYADEVINNTYLNIEQLTQYIKRLHAFYLSLTHTNR